MTGCDSRGPHERQLDATRDAVLNDPSAPQSAKATAETMTDAARPQARELDEFERKHPETAKYLNSIGTTPTGTSAAPAGGTGNGAQSQASQQTLGPIQPGGTITNSNGEVVSPPTR